MLHPDTEMRFVSPEIGYGIFASEDIPVGTIMWAQDQLDRIVKSSELVNFDKYNIENFLKYTYRNRDGDYVFCWDLTRYVNHSFEPNSILTPLGFEIVVKDIAKGDEITNDYGTFNIDEPFRCAKGPHGRREFVMPDDLERFHVQWDKEINSALKHFPRVNQPLIHFLDKKVLFLLERVKNGEAIFPSVLENHYRR